MQKKSESVEVYAVKFDTLYGKEYYYLSNGHTYKEGDTAHVMSRDGELKEVTVCYSAEIPVAELPVPLERMKSLIHVDPANRPKVEPDDFDADCTIYAVSYRETGPIAFRCVSCAHEFRLGDECYVIDDCLQPSMVTVRSATKCFVRDMPKPPEQYKQLYNSLEEMEFDSKDYIRCLEKQLHAEIPAFTFSYGGFFDGFTECEFDGEDFLIQNHNSGLLTRRKVTDEDWTTFISTCLKIGVDKWNESYVNPHILDGTGWDMEIKAGPLNVKSGGSNAFPADFQYFRRAVRKFLRLTSEQL